MEEICHRTFYKWQEQLSSLVQFCGAGVYVLGSKMTLHVVSVNVDLSYIVSK